MHCKNCKAVKRDIARFHYIRKTYDDTFSISEAFFTATTALWTGQTNEQLHSTSYRKI